MYAIVETGGKQYRVQPGDTIAVERLSGAPGETLDLERVLLLGGDGAETRVGAPGVAGAVVRAEVVEHAVGEKIIVFRYKSKVRYRRKTGHRQRLTRLRITDILLDGVSHRSPTAVAPVREPVVAEPAVVEPVVVEPVVVERRYAPETGAPLEAVEAELPATAAEADPEPEDAEAEQGE
ncbi:MAG: 50S ribosomal protein L21 [Chloroflexi bacterium]|nr:50S ribosomal protein L21 [Chloroflexota bacterium]